MAGAKNTKAYIVIKEASKSGGAGKIAKLEFQYNPEDLSISRKADWKYQGMKVAESPKAEFKGNFPRTLMVKVLLDSATHKSKTIMKDLKILLDTCQPTKKSIGQNAPSPPFVTFGWGRTIQFEAVMESVKVDLLQFSAQGVPLRAKVELQMTEQAKTVEGQNPTSGALAAERTHTVVEGDSLASIAYHEYGDPALWRAVAEANGVDDPLRLDCGASLLLPDIEEASNYQ